MGKFKVFLASVLLGVICTATPVFATMGINVETHTQQEIRDRIKNEETIQEYETLPVLTAPYEPGTLTQDTLKQALDTMNTIRYIAGIPDKVVLDNGYNEKAQAAAITNYANNNLSHEPDHPEGMSDELYNLGYEGSSKSNLAYTKGIRYSLSDFLIRSWMNDGDPSNIARVGHRRWILNPSMEKTGFGNVWTDRSSFAALYALDNSRGQTPYYGVAWPAQNMPVSFFGKDYPWTISMDKVVSADTNVVLTRKNDQKTWIFKAGTEDFYINNENYGRKGCIIFRPLDVGAYKAGDEFLVKITGTGLNVEYTVTFFAGIPVKSIELKTDKIDVQEGKSVYLGKTTLPSNTDETCSWVSSNEKIATVSESGQVEGISTGTVKIRLQNSDGSIYDECEVSVIHAFDPYGKEIKASSCTEPGQKEYECTVCGEKKFEEIKPNGHYLYGYGARDASCYYDGNIQYWQCFGCMKYFADEEGKVEIKEADVVIRQHHELQHVKAVEPTKTANGNNEYWHCNNCGRYFSDAEAMVQVSPESVIIPKKEEKPDGIGDESGGSTDTSTGDNSVGKDDSSTGNNSVGKDDSSTGNSSGGKDDSSTGNNSGGNNDNSSGNNNSSDDSDINNDQEDDEDITESLETVVAYLRSTKVVYTGKAIRPEVIVKDKDGMIVDPAYYTISYKNNVNVGKAAVIIEMDEDRYIGTYKLYFTINPKPVKIAKVTAAKKGFGLKWSKGVSITGYEIQYCLKKSFSGAKKLTVSASSIKKTVKGLKGKTKYYIRIRAFKKVSETKYYSTWSGAKSVTTKK